MVLCYKRHPTPEPYRIWPVLITSPRKKRQEQEEAKLLSWVGGKLVVFVCFCCCFSRGRRLYGHVFRQLTWLLVCTVRLGVVHHDPETGILKVINHFLIAETLKGRLPPSFLRAGRLEQPWLNQHVPFQRFAGNDSNPIVFCMNKVVIGIFKHAVHICSCWFLYIASFWFLACYIVALTCPIEHFLEVPPPHINDVLFMVKQDTWISDDILTWYIFVLLSRIALTRWFSIWPFDSLKVTSNLWFRVTFPPSQKHQQRLAEQHLSPWLKGLKPLMLV